MYIYVKGSLSCNELTYQALNTSNEHLEALVLDIILSQTRPIILINLYRAPSGKVPDGIDILQNILNQLPAKAEINLVGDLNIDLSYT